MGLNPVLLELAVGGAHNDTLIMLALAAALALDRRVRAPRFRAPARRRWSPASAIKVTAGLVLPFLVLAPVADRASACGVARSAALSLAGARAAWALIGFGSHALGFLDAVGEQQQLVATHSIPAETARLVGLSGHAELVAPPVPGAASWRCSRSRCGARRAAPTGASPPAGRRSRCCCRPPGCCRGMRSGCCR